jgi:hypothetical protein
MPVSKKRKKDGKPVHRKASAPAAEGEHPHGPEAAEVAPAPAGPVRPMGRPTNPFVAQQRRGSQRGR